MGDAGAQAEVEKTLFAEASRLNRAGYPAPLLAWQVHLRYVTEVAQGRGDEQGARLCHELGYHLRQVGNYTAARSYLERALAIREKVLGPGHPNSRIARKNLATLIQSGSRFPQAAPSIISRLKKLLARK